MARTFALAGLVPVGFQTMSLSNSTAVALNSTIQASASVLIFSVETNDVRLRDDGTDPTLSTGVLLEADLGPYQVQGYNGSEDWKLQRSTGTATVNIMGYKQIGARG